MRRRVDGDRRAIVTAEDSVTYAELDEASAALAARLVAAGVVKGDRVGLLAPNGIEWAATAFAALRIGAVLVPLSTLLRPPELLAQLTTASLSHLVTARGFRDRRYLDDLDAAAPGLATAVRSGARHAAAPSLRRLWTTDGLPEPAVPAGLVRALEARVRPADDLAVMFTSGSRGAPKGVIHTHGGALRATAAGLDARCVGPGERLYIPMPFFWMGGFGGGLLTALVAGATLLTEAEPDPVRTLELLQRERVTLFRGWPDQAARLAAHPAFDGADLSSLGDGSLAAVLPPQRRPAPGARASLFGMTESFGPYCGDRLDTDLPPGKSGSCGRPFTGVQVRIAGPGTGAELPAGGRGEIWLRGPSLMRGICGRVRSSVFTADGWYPTGDLGRVDSGGYLWYGGRLDDMVKVRGATVYPSEVESALRSIGAVTQAHVTDVPGPAGGVEVGAVVVTTAPPGEIVAAVRERLSSFKVPTRWLLTPDPGVVPVSATGKPDKARLQDLLRTRGQPSPGGATKQKFSLPWRREPGALEASLAAWARSLRGDDARVTDVRVPSSGMSNDTVMFRVSGESLVARLAPAPGSYPTFPAYDLELQRRVMDLVRARTAVPVPEVVHVEPSRAWLGVPFMVVRAVEGLVPSDNPPYLLDRGGWFLRGTPDDWKRLETATIDVIGQLHRIADDGEATAFLRCDAPGSTALARQLAAHRRYYEWARDGGTIPVLERAFEVLAATLPSTDRSVLNWGDARPGNIIYRDFEPVAVLDWEMAGIGPPEADVGWLTFFQRFFAGVAEQRGLPPVPAMFGRAETAARYQQLSGDVLDDLAWYEALAGLRFGIILARMSQRSIAFGLQKPPADPDDLIMFAPLLERLLGDL